MQSRTLRSLFLGWMVVAAFFASPALSQKKGGTRFAPSLTDRKNFRFASFVAVRPDGRVVVIGWQEDTGLPSIGRIFTIDVVGKMRLVKSDELYVGFVRIATLSPDGNYVAIAYDGTRTVQGSKESARLELRSISLHGFSAPIVVPGAHNAGTIGTISFDPSGRYFVSASYNRENRKLKLWDVANPLAPKLLYDLPLGYFDDPMNPGPFVLYRNTIILGERRIIDVASGILLKRFSEKEQPVNTEDIALARAQDVLVLAGMDAEKSEDAAALLVLDVTDPERPRRLQLYRKALPNHDYYTAVAVSADGHFIAAGTDQGRIVFFDSSSQTMLAMRDAALGEKVQSVSFAHDKKYCIAVSLSGTLTVWRIDR